MSWQDIVIEIAAIILTALGSLVLAKVKTLINTKVKNAKIAELLTRTTNIVASAVKTTYQTYVEGIKGTDQWTIEAQKAALLNALSIAKAQMTNEVKAQIESMYGNIDEWLTAQIESTLYELKNK